MRALLRQALAETLAPAGWVPATPIRESPFALAALVRPLDGGIAATASINRASSIPDRLPVRITHVFAGVCYEPLRRLWPLLGDHYELALRGDCVWPEEPADRVPSIRHEDIEVSSAAEAERAVNTLAALILREGVAFAARYGSLERLLAEFGYGEEQGALDERVVALLAAAGRLEEASAALARYRTETGDGRDDREARRFVHHVGRYIESGGDPAIVPRQPPPPEIDTVTPPSVSDIWRDARVRDEAVNAVMGMSPDSDRAELRAALERELAARGLSESPLWLEQTLDHLHDSSAERAQSLAKGVASAADLTFRAIRGLHEHRTPPDLSPPAWLDPPDRAAYPVTRSRQPRWTDVRLDEGTKPYLDRAYEAIPRLFGATAMATAWLSWAEGPHESLVVSLGEQRVGTVAPAAAAAYRLVMDRAAERDELPHVLARLTPRPDAHLLEVQLPATGS